MSRGTYFLGRYLPTTGTAGGNISSSVTSDPVVSVVEQPVVDMAPRAALVGAAALAAASLAASKSSPNISRAALLGAVAAAGWGAWRWMRPPPAPQHMRAAYVPTTGLFRDDVVANARRA
jgi:hypothetical protein